MENLFHRRPTRVTWIETGKSLWSLPFLEFEAPLAREGTCCLFWFLLPICNLLNVPSLRVLYGFGVGNVYVPLGAVPHTLLLRRGLQNVGFQLRKIKYYNKALKGVVKVFCRGFSFTYCMSAVLKPLSEVLLN